MAGTVTITEETGMMQKVTFAWTSDWFGGGLFFLLGIFASGIVVMGRGFKSAPSKFLASSAKTFLHIILVQ